MKNIIISTFFMFTVIFVFGQNITTQLVGSSGNSFSNEDLSLDWSLGETVTETFTSSSYTLTQGFHQSQYIISSLADNLSENINFKIFPNPTTDLIFINIETKNTTFADRISNNYALVLRDISGKILKKSDFNDETAEINFSQYAAGAYFVTILEDKISVKTFQIIKK